MRKATAKQLTLSKETLRTLSEAPLADVKGGTTPFLVGVVIGATIVASVEMCGELWDRVVN